MSPLLLELGVHPLVAAATSSLMVLFSASTAALAFAFDHLLNITYALVYGIGASLTGPGRCSEEAPRDVLELLELRLCMAFDTEQEAMRELHICTMFPKGMLPCTAWPAQHHWTILMPAAHVPSPTAAMAPLQMRRLLRGQPGGSVAGGNGGPSLGARLVCCDHPGVHHRAGRGAHRRLWWQEGHRGPCLRTQHRLQRLLLRMRQDRVSLTSWRGADGVLLAARRLHGLALGRVLGFRALS